MKLVALFLLLPVCLYADDLYKIHPLSEPELLQTYSALMRDACRHSDQFWHDWPVDSRAGFWGSGRSDNMNEGVRAISGMTLTCASLLKYSDILKEDERREYRRKALAAIRYATETHVTGTQTCPDGKPWGNSWQSAMWTADLAFGAWLIWDDLDAGLRKDLERVVAFESDRFLAGRPPAGSFNDTKAEENGWDLTCLAVAPNLFPDNPHAGAWKEKAIEYMMNTLSTPHDLEDTNMIDGRPVKDWVTGPNIHPDFTLENHGFFHPGYVGCSSYFLTQTGMYFTYAHQPTPAAARHHLMETWGMFDSILLPNGEAACPQGMDWELHGLPYLNLFASLATDEHDRAAAHLEETYLQYMRAWQVRNHGNLAVFGSPLGFTRHAICAQQAAYAFLAHKIFGPPAKELTAAETATQAEGVHAHDWIEVITHRTADKFASFSWTNRLMGMLIPIGAGHAGNPDFTVPIVNGFIGGFDLRPRGSLKTVVLEHRWKTMTNGFETSGTLLLDGGRLKQTLIMTSIGDKTVVYQDHVVAVKDITVTQERGIPLGIENDEVTGGSRAVTWSSGHTLFDQRAPKPIAALSGSWANVDSRLGIISLGGSGLTYLQATNYAPGISVRTDLLYGSYSKQSRHFRAGEAVARRIVVAYVEVTPQETALLAQAAHVEGQLLHLQLPDRPTGTTEATIELVDNYKH
jgi:hypothetical protein